MSLPAQIESLGAAQAAVRDAALTAVKERGAAAAEAITAGLKHPNWRVRRSCADLLDHLALSESIPGLLALLRDPSVPVRRLALHAIACQRCKCAPLPLDVVGELAELSLSDPSITVRRAAVHQLGCQPRDVRAAEAIRQVLARETDGKLRRIARWSLAQHA